MFRFNQMKPYIFNNIKCLVRYNYGYRSHLKGFKLHSFFSNYSISLLHKNIESYLNSLDNSKMNQ